MTSVLGDAVRAFLERQAFEPDPFQVEAVRSIERGSSVVVTAPTGSGKTLIAEAAIEVALAAGTRTFYTTPIKALSNQKYRDLVGRYGSAGVGLLTGDNTINGDAPIVVMTTEVLRNMIYADSVALAGLGFVILDEVHYLQDRYRGSVWEEVIIHLPETVQLVSLSATIANADEFTGWVRSRRGPTDLIVEERRPVPLESMFLIKDRHREGGLDWYPVFGGDGNRPNRQVVNLLRKGRGRRRRFATPRRLEVAEALLGAGLLPAIYFIFSRAGCDDAARNVAAAGLRLTSADERAGIRSIAEDATGHLDAVDLGVLRYDSWVSMLESGVAAHHAGMVPAYKETVEHLFAAGLVKLVFATETLALGINMPAKAVALESFSKFNGEHHELLKAGEYTQLTGRAGRRGMDEHGTAVVLYSPYVPFDKVAAVAGAGSHALRSSFEPSYNMAVNLVANHPRPVAENLLRASFAQFSVQQRSRRLDERIAERSAEVRDLIEQAQCDRGDIESYAAAPIGSGEGLDAVREFLGRLDSGDVLLSVDGKRWVILARGYGSNPRYSLVSEDGECRKVDATGLGPFPTHMGRMALDQPIRTSNGDYVETAASALADWAQDAASPVVERASLEDTPAACPDLQEHLACLARSKRVAKDLRRLERRRARVEDDVVDRFHSRVRVLSDLGYVKRWELAETGSHLRRIYCELDLVLVEAAAGGVLDGLSTPELAAVVSLFTYEPRTADPETVRLVGAVAERYERVAELWRRISEAEARHGVPPTRSPDPGFAPSAYAWASGADLEDLFGDDDFAAGDFVRNSRQLLDLMRQIRDAFPSLADASAQVITATDRGIVSVGGRA